MLLARPIRYGLVGDWDVVEVQQPQRRTEVPCAQLLPFGRGDVLEGTDGTAHEPGWLVPFGREAAAESPVSGL